jgi:hypothetical protein
MDRVCGRSRQSVLRRGESTDTSGAVISGSAQGHYPFGDQWYGTSGEREQHRLGQPAIHESLTLTSERPDCRWWFHLALFLINFICVHQRRKVLAARSSFLLCPFWIEPFFSSVPFVLSVVNMGVNAHALHPVLARK